MKRLSLSALIVLALISIDATISVSFAEEKITIFKVTKVSPENKLKMRAWPSTKSRVKTSIPYNAKDLTETGKQKVVDKTKWVEVNWKDNRGWVIGRYLTKTGVLVRPDNKTIASRNSKSTKKANEDTAKVLSTPVKSLDEKPQEFSGDRYDQPIQQVVATEMKMAFAADGQDSPKQQMLLCSGKSPKLWNMKLDVADKNMKIKFSKDKGLNIPINYHAWATPNKLRMNIGGNQGRNIVDVNLEKTNACRNGLSKTKYTYEVNATINRNFYSGCCEVVTE